MTEIAAYENKIAGVATAWRILRNDGGTVYICDQRIDRDIAMDALTNQKERYEKKIIELQKQFDEL